ncbi:BCCT family transporter [Nesterenkonia sp. LB17]|uniref:BCCT family transporter n=1 Tax=unclassified Nesterenkonia TaxID=2629769 RepID=UPI001F4C6DB2|nr:MULTISPECIES: BCCT family transporter [unclassified Nesterenkonia]MCH8559421.1 BCCT family transporter [Nesterenkonia sp. DZ6]MCH8563301.1 BCCT family transporter [Nesterenkonia sp. YGD6]MCH8564887.1 BCCT family transporter [Nesterenkonia sp. LB17]
MLLRLHNIFRLRTSPILFFGSAAIVITFVVLTLLMPTGMGEFFGTGSGWIYDNLGWFYISGVTIFLIFLIFVASGRFGRIRLGADGEEPEHSNIAWFGMLFAAGIGTILMFWAVAEPANHFANPPREGQMGVEPRSMEAANEAMGFTLYHFGLHTWTIFALPGLAFAYFIYKRNLPPRVSSIFQPMLGDKIHGPIGKFIDILAIVGTIFGVAVSIGLGTLQIHAGLARLLGVSDAAWNFIIIIAVVTIIATISAMLGVNKGIKRLSNFNIWTAIGLLLFVLITGPTVFMLRGMIEWTGVYARMLPELAFWNDTLANTGWQDGWTIFYWAWTVAWAPFVGIFIARISRGRSVRQFVAGVLGLPTLFTIIWFGIWGAGTFDIELNGDGGLVDTVLDDGVEGALFAFLAEFPLATLTSSIAIMLVGIFFITSMDSCSLVLDDMCNGYEGRSPLHQRAFWTISIGTIAAILLTATGEGGLQALQNVALVLGLPFFVLGYFMMFNLSRAMREDAGEVGFLVTRRWLKTLPPEEYERRMEEPDRSLTEAVVAPDYHEGTQPENAPDVDHVEQPPIVEQYRVRTGDVPIVDPAQVNGSYPKN